MSFSPPEPTDFETPADPAAEFLLTEARKRLRAALEGLEQALSRHTQLVLEQADQIAEYAALQEDRSRLAQELDAATRREHLLEAANLAASRRIERASAAVRAVIAADPDPELQAAPEVEEAPEPDAEAPPEPDVEQAPEHAPAPGADPARES